ncbi:hypothetical protein GCM10023189_47410 [Nibrella saemangeumensis]|uniref:histidine kinase n=1 Tax=Nibrella saemangeumensis TaxID=1084526 RepID=A0ABP8NIA5_9BACT
MSPTAEPKSARLVFTHLPGFAAFIVANHLEAFVREQIRLLRQLNNTLLSYFDTMPEEELVAFSKLTTGQFFQYFVENRAPDQIRDAMEQWVTNQLPVVNQNQIVADDITQVNYVRKQTLYKFLPLYTTDLATSLAIIGEFDEYIMESEAQSFQTLFNLQQKQINEHLHFIERITNTSPGIIFVFDLLERKEVYTNENLQKILGITRDDLHRMGGELVTQLLHPDDIARGVEHAQVLANARDGEVYSFEFRVKHKAGHYRWMRSYETVFRRNEQQPAQIIGIAFDIGHEKETAQQLAYREQQLLEAQELAELGSFEWNLHTMKATYTPQVLRILNINDGDGLPGFLGKIHPDDKDRVQQALEQAIKNQDIYDSEYRYLTETGDRIIWSRGSISIENGVPVMKGTVMNVTERHRMVQQLQQSESLYKQAQALTHIGNWAWDVAANKVAWSDEMYRIYGLVPQSAEVTFERFLQLVHPDDRNLTYQHIKNSLDNQQPNDFFHRIILNDGTVKVLHAKGEVVLDKAGTVIRMIGTGQDVTLQKTTEKELLEKQNFIQKIADATPSIIASYNINTGKYTFVSQGLEKLLGYNPREVMEADVSFFANLIHPDDMGSMMERNAQALKEANESGADDMIVEFTYRMRHRNGEYRWFHTYGTIFDRNPDGHVEHVLNISMDVTETVEAEQRIREQELFIEHIADASPAMLYLYDLAKQQVIYVNKEITSVLGYTAEDILDMGESFRSVLSHPDDAGKLPDMQYASNGKGERKNMYQYECRMRHKELGWRWMLVREMVFKKDRKGNVQQVLGAALDISEQKDMERSLFQKTLQLQQSNASLKEFAYIASHDLKEPLRKISTFGDRLLVTQYENLTTDGQAALSKIIDSSQRMQLMINDILSVSMISGDVSFQPFSLQTILKEVLQTLEHRIESKNAVIEADKLPVLNIVPSQFRQLFQNLLSNSLKFAREDVAPKIHISCTYLSAEEVGQFNMPKAKRYIQLTFTDNGIGFDNRFAGKIFAIFQRLHNKNDYEGTGIGLAICKKIVENHGGVIFASGIPDQGSTFTVILPD